MFFRYALMDLPSDDRNSLLFKLFMVLRFAFLIPMKPLSANQLRGNWATLLAAWNRDESLDLGRVAAEIDTLIAMKVDGIYSNGTAGEFHTLDEAEFDQLAELLATRCEPAGMPFQIGVSHPVAQVMLARLKRVVPLAPSAVQVILPDWFPLTDDEALAFLRRMAEAAGGVGMVLYNPPHAKRRLDPAALGRLAAAVPELVGVKVAGGDDAWYAAMRPVFQRLSVFVPGHQLASGFARGAHGAYSNVACLHPAAAQRWWEQMQTDLPAALELETRIRRFMDDQFVPFIRDRHFCNGACDRLLANLGGWADVGPAMRWPYRSIPAAEADRLRPIAFGLLPEFFPTA
jgi:dihydrodipicolinate synthase/N-acetylneuraminate lyase